MLIKGSFNQTAKKVAELIKKKKPIKLIAVGDRVSRTMIHNGIPIDVVIIDYKIMRRSVSPLRFKAERIFKARNPAGTLTKEAWSAVEAAVKSSGSSKVIIEGEEDLLTLVAVLSAPNGSMIFYGQPKEGVVILEVNEELKRVVRGIIERMERINSS